MLGGNTKQMTQEWVKIEVFMIVVSSVASCQSLHSDELLRSVQSAKSIQE